MEEPHLSLSGVAQRLKKNERTIRRWIKSGKLRAYKPGRDYLIPESAIRELIEESEVRPKAAAPPSPEQPFLNGFEEERREDANDVALTAARRQAAQDRQAAARAFESERPQTYFMRHENEAISRLLQHRKHELAEALIESARHVVQLEEQIQQMLETKSEQIAEKAQSDPA